MQRLVYRGSDAVTTNAQSVGEQIHRKLGVPRERIHYLPNGIDLEAWDRKSREVCPLALEPGAFHLALVGGLRREKNHERVLAALELLGRERTRDWRVWFVGAESGGRRYAHRVREQIARRGLGAIVRVEPPTPAIAALMRRLAGVLLPSDFEGFPNVALEAMASRLPVIATPVGDVPNMIEDGASGLLLASLEPSAIAAAMERLYALGPEGRAAIGERARGVVERRYTIGAVAARHLELYRRLLCMRAAA
jgi:glycosyltransferase involved in cell wall biosynthesis